MSNKKKAKHFLKLITFYLINFFIISLEIFILANIVSSFFIKKQRNFYEICAALYKDFFIKINFNRLSNINLAKKLENINIKFFSKKINQMIRFSIKLFCSNLIFFSIITFCILYKAKLAYKCFFHQKKEIKINNLQTEKKISFIEGFVYFIYGVIILSVFFEIIDISFQKLNFQNIYSFSLICLISLTFLVYTSELIYSCIKDLITSIEVIRSKDIENYNYNGPLSEFIFFIKNNDIEINN
jgi:hypothetical protein